MLGDAQTVSDEDNERESLAFDASPRWSTPSSPAGLGLPIAPSWDDSWATPAAATVEPNGWDAEPINAGAAAPEPGGFAGWGGLSSTDSSPVTHDLSAWDSPSDAVVAGAPNAPWGLDPAAEDPPAEEPVWRGETGETPSVSAWSSLPVPPSSAASAWAPGTLPASIGEAPEPTDRSEDHATLPAPRSSVTTSWFEPEASPSAIDSWPASAVAATTPQLAPEDTFAPALEVSAKSTSEVAGRAYSGVPFHELAAAFAASDQVPVAEPVPGVATATPVEPIDGDPSIAVGSPATKRRGRLAARSWQRNAPTTEVAPDSMARLSPSADTIASAADNTELPGPVGAAPLATPAASPLAGSLAGSLAASAPINVVTEKVETEAPPVAEAPLPETDALPVDHVATAAADADALPAVQAPVSETDALPVDQAPVSAAETDVLPVDHLAAASADTDDAAGVAPKRGFFAKRDPRAVASSPRETPQALRIAAVVSLIVGVGLFGYSVVTSRSSDTTPSVATTPTPVPPSAGAPTSAPAPVPPLATSSLPTAPSGEAGVVPESPVDPIFASDQATPSSSVPASPTASLPTAPSGETGAVPESPADPIFGSEPSVTSLSPPAETAISADPIFGPPPTVPS